MSYIPGFDGLRAIAVFAVIGYHLQIPGFQLGGLGVSLFFVLSGFLITRILLRARTEPHYFRRFYARRALRIFPIYYLSLGLIMLGPWDTHAWPWYALYAQNWLIGFKGLDAGFPWFFAHTWSLSVEEQFYLLWPLVVLYARSLFAWAVAIILIAEAFTFAFVLSGASPYLTSLLPCVSGLLAWGVIALLAVDRRIKAKVVFWICTSMFAAFVFIRGPSQFWTPSGFGDAIGMAFGALIGPMCAALVLMVYHGSFVRVLELGPVRYLGRISYGLYLYHLPIIAFAPRWAVVPLTILTAAASYRFIEQPLLTLKAPRPALI